VTADYQTQNVIEKGCTNINMWVIRICPIIFMCSSISKIDILFDDTFSIISVN